MRTSAGEQQQNPNKRHLVVDHIIPHKGNLTLFYDAENLQTLCPDHHYSEKQEQERRGFSTRVGTDGWAKDAKHPVNKI